MNFIAIAQAGFEEWAAKPHNAKWFRKIDGTPIPNDLPVCIAQAFSEALTSQSAELLSLRRKVEEQRRALEQIADDYKTYKGHGDYDEDAMGGREAQKIARAALTAARALQRGGKVE